MATAASTTDPAHTDPHDFNHTRLDCHSPSSLARAYQAVRADTEQLAAPLTAEDQNLQSMPGASPIKWHRAHTSWFFETFILKPQLGGYSDFHPRFNYLYNSYYNGIGEQYPRPHRGLISRPDIEQISAYRAHVDQAMLDLLASLDGPKFHKLGPLIVLGLNHEQQHQELMVTDLKHAFSHNPLAPEWVEAPRPAGGSAPLSWLDFNPGLTEIGSPDEYFCFDNETPAHKAWLNDFQLANRPVSCGDFLAFIEDRGYQRPELWLADGWDWVRQSQAEAPLYWSRHSDHWVLYTLGGMRRLDPHEPLCHVNFYEAAAYAQWAGARLPTEAEWEHAAATIAVSGHFANSGRLHPQSIAGNGLLQMFGDVWEWTSSGYAPYPGFKPPAGAVGEYNGKFMANQVVLRGGSCATAAGHVRAGYRNFFYPADRWQFSGLRLARDLD
jgi:ergothioneine biosynthesis protein EgtB